MTFSRGLSSTEDEWFKESAYTYIVWSRRSTCIKSFNTRQIQHLSLCSRVATRFASLRAHNFEFRINSNHSKAVADKSFLFKPNGSVDLYWCSLPASSATQLLWTYIPLTTEKRDKRDSSRKFDEILNTFCRKFYKTIIFRSLKN